MTEQRTKHIEIEDFNVAFSCSFLLTGHSDQWLLVYLQCVFFLWNHASRDYMQNILVKVTPAFICDMNPMLRLLFVNSTNTSLIAYSPTQSLF